MLVGSLFSGIGGFELGLERAGMSISWQVEIDPFCRAVLEKHWPNMKRHEDVREVGSYNLEPVDLVCGGFPCQDISSAGKRTGLDGRRSGLWSEMFRIICELRPQYVIVENVAALLQRGIGRVLGDLASVRYDAEWFLLPAYAVGALHFRCRLFVVAYSPVADSGSIGRRENAVGKFGKILQEQIRAHPVIDSRTNYGFSGATPEGAGWWAIAPPVGRVADGIPARLDRLHGLGNAVVPQIAEVIGRAIMEANNADR